MKTLRRVSTSMLLAAFLLTPDLALSQIRSGTLVGTVQDGTSAPVPDADVTIREVNTNATYEQKSSGSGEFLVPYLPFGNYSVTVKKTGFRTTTQTDILLSAAQTVRVDLKLDIGSVDTTITVVGSATELQTESSRVQNTVSEQIIKSIPNINNNPLNYATLQLGVVSRAAMNDTQSAQSFGIGTEGRRTFSNFQINGGSAFSNDIQLDGVSIQASAWNEVAVLPNTEGIQEVKTTVNNMSAEYGRSQGTVMITTKSGTNQFHGSGQFRLRNEALNANSFSSNTQGIARTPFKQQGYSATFGGPVLLPKLYNGRDKTFFFVSYEGLRFNQALNFQRTVPTALERQGNFSQTVANVNGQFLPVRIFDPFNVTQVTPGQFQRAEFPNAIIPQNRINPFQQKLVNEFPLPNRTPDDPTGVNNYLNTMTRKFVRDAINARLDHRMTRHSLYGTFGSNLGSINSPNGWGDGTRAYIQQGGFIGAVNGDRNYYGSIGDTWVLAPTLVADFRVGLTRVAAQNRASTFDDIDYSQFGLPAGWSSAIGLAGAYPEVTGFGGGFSQISPLNQTAYLAKIERQTNWNLVGSVTKIAGSWTHKWGGEYRVYLSNYTDARGSFNLQSSNNFTNGNLIDPSGNNITSFTNERGGSGLASSLLGAGSVAAGENAVLMALAAKYLAFYNQSDWRVNSRLTMNFGLRYDIQPGPTERFNRLSSFSFKGTTLGTPGALVFPGTNGVGRNLYRTPLGDWGPRIGLAFRASDSFVIRSGFGVNYLPSNTGYFGGPYYYGNQNFAPVLSAPNALQYGPNPAGALLAPFNQVNTLFPVIGANNAAPQYYGAGGNEPRFDYDGFQNGKILQWNLFLEKRLGKDYVISGGYAGTRGYRLPIGRMPVNTDQYIPDALAAQWRQSYIATNGTRPDMQLVANPFQTTPGQTIPFNGNLRNASIPLREALLAYPLFPGNLIGRTVGYSTYNAFMTQVSKSYSSGLLFNLHYTWSRTLEFANPEAQNNNYAENAGFGNTDRRNYQNSYFISANDIPHRVVGTIVYSLPFGKGRRFGVDNKFVNALAGGWNIGSVVTLQSGQPQTGFGGGANSLNGVGNRISGEPIEVPKELQRWYNSPNVADRTVTLPGGRAVTVCRYCFLKYNLNAFRAPVVQLANGSFAPDIYWWGNSASRYGDVRTRGRANVNMSVQKEFSAGERLQFQLSAEASNLLNNAQFRPAINGGLGAVFTAPNPAQGVVPGMTQNSNFGTYGLATFDPRQVELRLRVRF